jgi:hypothetical protein
MNHLWRGKAFTIPGPVLNYGGAYIGGAQLMPVPPPKNPGCPKFGVGMPHAQSGGDALRATSHTRLRAHDHYTSSTLIGGKDGAGSSSLHTTLEGPTEDVNAR